MKPVKIVTALEPAGSIPVEFPEHTGIEPFTVPIIPLIDKATMEAVDKWMADENARREKDGRSGVTNYEMCEQLLKHVVDDETAAKVAERPLGERLQLWDAWLSAALDGDDELGESSDS
ncbi:hypothetical protein [Corynebacterium sp. TAE3-ERU2]|uniref:hypothetical protein n=1 Tax=Corynebacterium sp. TAE3-ERU2 TaxID=2849497 RepID=UPI001C47D0A0|nr:hypothetical protein [Corynebacterium sp. TAE3-ERU2]MBV7302933.1 hypothetical protein [Corynebacterium sp. TAE3-ERU2]